MQNKIVHHSPWTDQRKNILLCLYLYTGTVMNNNMAFRQHREQVQKPNNFSSKCWNVDILLFIHLFVCMQPRSFCMRTKTLAQRGVNLIVWACTSVCVWLGAGLPTIPLINSSCGLANDCSSSACLSLCLALISSWQHHMRDEWTLAQNGITRLLAVIRSHTKKSLETEEVIKREKRERDSPHLSRFN